MEQSLLATSCPLISGMPMSQNTMSGSNRLTSDPKSAARAIQRAIDLGEYVERWLELI